MKLESLDLNLLLAFDAIASERSVTRAAAKVGLSQPAMSNALSRLRRVLRDPLFVREGGEMQPTTRARQLSVPVCEALTRLREALEPQGRFEPAKSSREFQVVTNDAVEAVLLAPLLRELGSAAPSISVRTMRGAYLFDPPADRLESGEVDLAIGFFPESATPRRGLLSKTLLEDRFVAVVRAGHPRLRDRLTMRAFLEIPHVRVLYPGQERAGIVDATLRGRWLARRVALTVPHLASVPPIVARTDLLGIVPERLARAQAGALRLKVHPLPFALAPFPVVMIWHEGNELDAAHAWLRGLAERALAPAGRVSPPAAPSSGRPARRSSSRASR